MEIGTASILVQLLLIFILVVAFAGRRHLRARREHRHQQPGGTALPGSPAPSVPSAEISAPALVDLPPMVRHAPGLPDPRSFVSEELLPPCFADTCADWAQVDAGDVLHNRAASAPLRLM